MLNKITYLTPIVLGCILTHFGYASDFQSPRTAALGGAGHASPLLSDSIYLNPSFASFTKTHSLSTNYLKYDGGTTTTPEGGITDYYGHNLNISVLDGTPDSIFQAGVGYTRREDASLIHVGASKNFFQDVGIGIGSKFILPNNGTGERLVDATFSLSGLATSWFQASVVIDNIIGSAKNLGFYREYILGTKFNVDSIVLVYLDPHIISGSDQGSLFGYEAGIEFPFFSEVFLRVGTFRNAMIPHEAQKIGSGYGLGLGWIGPKLSIDYSFSRVTEGIPIFAHNFGFTIFF